jgi:hypothetical protein
MIYLYINTHEQGNLGFGVPYLESRIAGCMDYMTVVEVHGHIYMFHTMVRRPLAYHKYVGQRVHLCVWMWIAIVIAHIITVWIHLWIIFIHISIIYIGHLCKSSSGLPKWCRDEVLKMCQVLLQLTTNVVVVI